ncbi:putative ferric-chelate reductase 1 [Watersipora subatra]|uniref:putative ferric-chelate reductase 1 n=1 Tax=Watersipora subatra TaxID=2589382 RepID=UPI00355AFB22
MLPSLLALLFLGSVTAYQRGAPITLCYDPYPHHHAFRSEEPLPYTIQLDKQTYNPGDMIKVTVSGTEPFNGLQIAVHTLNGDWNTLFGEFMNYSQALQAYPYYDNVMNCLTHSEKSVNTNSEVFYWKAPAVNYGDLIFSATLVKSFEVFWVNVTAEIRAASIANVITPPQSTIGYGSFDSKLDLSECGKESGCITHPANCKEGIDGDCMFAVAYMPVSGGVRFRLTHYKTEEQSSYMALGISEDEFMDHDETFTCSQDGTSVDLAHGYNPAMYNIKVQSNTTTNIAVEVVDDSLVCEFTRPETSSFNYYGHTGLDTHKIDYMNGIRTPEHHLYVAFGERYAGSHSSVVKHHILPIVSTSKVSFGDNSRHSFYTLALGVKAHIILMAISWAAVAGVAMVVARYYKDGFLNSTDRLWGLKPWFQVHRILISTLGILTGVAFIVIFVHYGKINQLVHAACGIVVVGLTTLQIIVGIARPDPGTIKRTVFNWFHRLTAISAYILAAATMLIGAKIEYMNQTMQTSVFGLLFAMVLLPVVILIILEIIGCQKDESSPETQAKSTNGMQVEEKEAADPKGVPSSHKTSFAIFITFVVAMTALLIAFIIVVAIL